MRSLKTEVDECIELVNTWETRIKLVEQSMDILKEEVIDMKKRFLND